MRFLYLTTFICTFITGVIKISAHDKVINHSPSITDAELNQIQHLKRISTKTDDLQSRIKTAQQHLKSLHRFQSPPIGNDPNASWFIILHQTNSNFEVALNVRPGSVLSP